MVKKHAGQNLVDYALILALIGVVAIGGLVACSGSLKTFFDARQAEISGATGGTPPTAP
jgi:Flp pilus assembly pilin Flp